MSREQHYATWETLAALFLQDCGKSSKDATRLNYLPYTTPHPEAAQFTHGDGALFPVSVPSGMLISEPLTGQQLTDGPVEGYNGPEDDEALLAFMMTRINGPAQAFGSAPTFSDLWHGNGAKIALQFPPEEDGQEF